MPRSPLSLAPAAALTLPSHAPAAARAIEALLQRLAVGTLELQWPDGQRQRFGSGGEPQAVLRLTDWGVCAAVLRSGDIGFAEAWIAGQWRTPDLPGLLRLLAANRSALDQAVYGHWWGRLAYRLRHLLQRNSRAGSRRNIHAHYDLGNAFYRLWLDETLSYSAACFEGDLSGDLAQAQRAKIDRALRACHARPGDRVLEIGCGWGGIAEEAARRGMDLVGVTLSTEQLVHARQRLDRAGLADRADLRLQDYRDIDDGPFDAVVSIEMFEAVGQDFWPVWFQQLRRQLKPGGRACIQSITIDDALFDRYVRGTDFIQQYIFPGGLLPSRERFRAAAARAGLVVTEEHAFGRDYAETLRRWRAAFLQQEPAVRALGFDTRFLRTWDFYLAYCEAAFDVGDTDVVQFTLRHAEPA